MSDGESGESQKSSFERRKRGFFRRNWFVMVIGLICLLVLSGAFAYWWWVPRYVQSVVVSMEKSMERITGVPVAHASVELRGLDRLQLGGITMGDGEDTLLTIDSVEVEFDPFAFSEGLPTVLLISADGVAVKAVRYADGTDNVSMVARSIINYLNRPRDGDGEASKLARLLRQTPAVRMSAVEVVVEEDGVEGRTGIVHLSGGRFEAENPGVTLLERKYAIEAEFAVKGGSTRARISCDVDISERQAQVKADFAPPLYVPFRGQEFELEELSYRSGEFLEARLGRVALTNPASNRNVLDELLARVMPPAGAGGQARTLNGLAETLSGKVRPLLARAGYSPEVWKRYSAQMVELANVVVRKALSEAEGEQLVLDSARVLYLTTRTRSGTPQRKLKLAVRIGREGGGELSVVNTVGTEDFQATFDVVSPSQMFQVAGTVQKKGERVEGRADVTATMRNPLVQLRGTIGYANGLFDGDFRAQFKSPEPALALSADLLFGDGKVTGEVEGEFLVPDIIFARKMKASFQKNDWSVEASGLVYPPGKSDGLDFHLSLDSTLGIKRASVAGQGDVRIPLGKYDLLLRKARLGRDSVVHLEDLVLTRKGGDRERALLKVADLAMELNKMGLELIETIRTMDFDDAPERLAGKLLSSVEVVEPVVFFRQPPRLELAQKEEKDTSSEDLAEKMSDALEEEGGEAVVMPEPFRKSLGSVVLGTGSTVRSLIKTFLDVGDRFPIDSVEIKEGRFEYSDAVSAQDRLLSELSHFNARIEKIKRAGNLGGRFAIDADFATAAAGQESPSRLKAEVDLATGDLTGELTVDRLALFPYRFFLPSLVAPSRLSFLEASSAGFSYRTETDRFRVWARGRLTDVNILSKRISTKPLEHLTVDFTIGSDEKSGLVFELERSRLQTSAPISLAFGRIKRLALELAVDAANPEYPSFEFVLRLPDMSVNDLLSSIPKGLGERLSGLQVGGSVGFTMTLDGDSRNLRGTQFRFSGDETGLHIEAPGRHTDFSKLSGAFKHRPPTDRSRTVLVGAGENYVPLSGISPWLVLAVTTCEDGSFFRHSGFNTYQIKMSIIRNLEKGRFVRGGSTITMQLVKNLFLSHEKTVARKLQEIILTWLIEREIEKDKLIEVYLNIIEWGNGIYGIKEACDYYFGGLPPANLSPAQAAFLASFIPYPRPFSARFKKGMFGADRSRRWKRWWKRRLKIVKRIVRAMVNNCHKIDSKCPSEQAYCRIMAATCRDPGRELIAADNLKELDAIFVPWEKPSLGDSGATMEF